MAWGMRQWDPDTGVQILDTFTDTLNRFMGTASLDDNAGSLTDARFAAGVPFVMINPGSPFTQLPPKTFSFSGNTMSWNGGPGCIVRYGVGAGVSSYNPVTNGTRIGFQARSADGTVVVLDETMFALQLLGKGSISMGVSANTYTADVSCPDGQPPAVAIRSDGSGHVYFVTVTMINANTARMTFGNDGPTTLTWYAFGKVNPALSRGIGARWWSSDGSQLMGDTSIPIARLITANRNYNLLPARDGQGPLDYSEAAGKKVAVFVNHSGFYLYKSAASGGGGNTGGASLELYRAAIRTYSDNGLTVKSALIQQNAAGGTNVIRTSVPAVFTTIDVTGI
jgi:hypothetical protein